MNFTDEFAAMNFKVFILRYNIKSRGSTLECSKIEGRGSNDVFSADFRQLVLSGHEELSDDPGIQKY